MANRPFSIHPGTKLGYVSLTVSNLACALGFYEDVLGLRTIQARNRVTMLGVDDKTPLVALLEEPDARPKPPRTTGLYHFAVLLPSRAELGRILQRLIAQRYPLQGAADHGVSEAIYLDDPEGNGIEIYADRPRDEWPWHSDQLQMVTDPLDTDSLLRQAGDGASGLPSDTRIGHIHLQVSDLNQAQKFYCDVLGFDLMQRFPPTRGTGRDPSALFLSAGGYHHHVGLNIWAGAGAPPPPPDAVGLRHYVISVPDETELARLTARLKAAEVPFSRSTLAGSTSGTLLVRDPSGNGILIDSA